MYIWNNLFRYFHNQSTTNGIFLITLYCSSIGTIKALFAQLAFSIKPSILRQNNHGILERFT